MTAIDAFRPLRKGLVAALRMTPRAAVAQVALLACMTLCLPAYAAGAGIASDDARETRWANEIVPQLVVGDAVWLATPHRARVLALYAKPSGTPKGAVIVVHGLGVHPDWNLIGELRTRLVDRDFVTLSVQMPVLAADAPSERYGALAPLAAERLDAALAWLRAHGHPQVAVVSHSLGAAFVNRWLARNPAPAIDAWVPVGLMAPFASPPRIPVLDVIAEADYPEAIENAGRRRAALPHDPCSRPVTIAATDHFMNRAHAPLVDAVAPILDDVFAGKCR
jgi:pimeloyl-ACP methyl ester carboxylesterase